MRVSRLILTIAIVCFFATVVSAQEIGPGYGFLEVVDFEGKPLAGAKVESLNGKRKPELTDKKGKIERGVFLHHRHRGNPSFRVSLTGYHSFTDYFEIFEDLLMSQNRDAPRKLVLLPLSKEREIVEQQQSREVFVAARTGDSSRVKELISGGLDPNVTTSDLYGVPVKKEIPLMVFAAKSGDAQTVYELVDSGAKLEESKDFDLFMYFLRYYPRLRVKDSSDQRSFEAGAIFLVRNGVRLYRTSYRGDHALSLAAGRGMPGLVKVLLEYGFPVDLRNSDQETALMNAARSGDTQKNIEIAGMLIDSGASIDDIDRTLYRDECFTALSYAFFYENPKMVDYLIKRGADINTTCPNGETFLDQMLRHKPYDQVKRKRIIDSLREYGAIQKKTKN